MYVLVHVEVPVFWVVVGGGDVVVAVGPFPLPSVGVVVVEVCPLSSVFVLLGAAEVGVDVAEMDGEFECMLKVVKKDSTGTGEIAYVPCGGPAVERQAAYAVVAALSVGIGQPSSQHLKYNWESFAGLSKDVGFAP